MRRPEDWCMLIGSLCAVMGFTYDEVKRFTLGQCIRYGNVVPDILPIRNPMAGKKNRPLEGDEAIAAAKLWSSK